MGQTLVSQRQNMIGLTFVERTAGCMPYCRPLFGALRAEDTRPMAWLVLATVALIVCASIATGLVPILFKSLIDSLESGRSSLDRTVALLIGAYAAAQLVSRALMEARTMAYGRMEQRLQKQLSNHVFAHILCLPARLHLESGTGPLNQTLANGLLGYRMLLQHTFLIALPALIELSTIGVVLVLFDQFAFLAIALVSSLLYGWTFRSCTRSIAGPSQQASKANIRAAGILSDAVLNFEIIKQYVAERRIQQRYADATSKVERAWTGAIFVKFWSGLIVAAIFAASICASLVIAAIQVRQGRISTGEFVLVNTYILQVTRPVETVGFAIRAIAEGLSMARPMVELLDLPTERDNGGSKQVSRQSEIDVTFDRVSFGYSGGRQILTDISLSISSGQTIAVVGPSGSGKSTLVRLLTRLIEPTEGEIRVNGTPLRDIPMSALREIISVVPQEAMLFNDSIEYNVALGKPDASEEELVGAAKIARIHDFIASLPYGYKTQVGERGLKLSGGERQRVAIARAAIKDPAIFLFDEATSSLDSDTETYILRNLKPVVRSAATLVIAHRLATVAHADEIVVLNRGQIVERGNHHRLVCSNGPYASMWQLQTRLSDFDETAA